MRTPMLLVVAASSAAAFAACKWTEFDDLQGQTWVDSTEKPNIKSSDWGVAIQRGADAGESGSSGTIAVIGAGPGTYSELAYKASGAASLQTNSLTLSNLGIMTLDPQPIFLASPTSSEVALATTGDSGSIAVAAGTHKLEIHQLSVTNTTIGAATTLTTPDAATYMHPPPYPGITTPPDREPLVAVGDVVMGTVYGLPPGNPQPACKLTEGIAMGQVQVRALGAVANLGGTDDVLVWNGVSDKILRYPTDVFNGCMPPLLSRQSSNASAGPVGPMGFTPGRGSQILPIDDTFVLLQGQEDPTKGNASFLQIFNATTMTPVGSPIAKDGIRSAAVLTTPGGQYVMAGFPNEGIEGVTGGVVRVFKFDTASGLDETPVATLHDAQPSDNQLFGRSVAVVPFNGKQVIAVAADNEIFVYFRVNATDGTSAPLYEETRQGP